MPVHLIFHAFLILKNYFVRFISYRNIAFRMGATKSYEFSVKENKLAKVAKALGHPARIAILNLLAKRQTCVCGDIVDELPLSQSTVSQHLKELKEAGLITGEIEGAKVCYCIDAKEWKAAQAVLNQMFETYKGGSKCC
jgi:DNA-binding transcriptional ArsR family regulator